MLSYPFAGLDPATGDPLGYLGKSVSKDYLALGNQLYDTSNLIYHGSAIPTLFGNLNNTVSYKGFGLGINIRYAFGYYFRKNTISYYDLYNRGVLTKIMRKDGRNPETKRIQPCHRWYTH